MSAILLAILIVTFFSIKLSWVSMDPGLSTARHKKNLHAEYQGISGKCKKPDNPGEIQNKRFPGNPYFKIKCDKKSIRPFNCLKSVMIMLIPTIILFASGWLSNFSLYIKENSSSFDMIAEIKEAGDITGTAGQGRISGHITSSGNGYSFYFDMTGVKIKNRETGTDKMLEVKDTFYVIVSSSGKCPFERDDFIIFDFLPVQKGEYKYLYTYEDNINELESHRIACNASERFISNIYKLRQRFYRCISTTFYSSLKYEHAAFCEAVILGNKNNLTDRITEDFKKSGIYHLLAISGMHISFFLFIICLIPKLFFTGNSLKKTWNKAAIFIFTVLVIFILVLYNFIVGARASILRASLMAIFVFFAERWGREYDRKLILSVVFIFLLAANPSFFYDPGFWLSFVSVFAIIYSNDIFRKTFKSLKQKICARLGVPAGKKEAGRNFFAELAVTTLSVSVFIFPVTVYLFQEFSILSLPVNMAAVPLFYLLLFVLLVSTISSLFWPPLAISILKPSKFIISLLAKLSALWKRLDFGVIALKNFGPLNVILYYLFLIIILAVLYKIFVKKRRDEKY